MRRVALAELGGRGSFMASALYGPDAGPAAQRDPVAEAFEAGMAEGRRLAEERAAALSQETTTAERAIELAFARFDAESAHLLQERLRSAVVAICQAMAGDIAIDPERLAARVEAAATLLRRRHDQRIIRLHPADIALVRERVDPRLTIEPDSALGRGQLRVEGEDGGIEDGAEQWRAALAEALGACSP